MVLSEALTPFAPLPFVRLVGDSFELIEEEDGAEAAPRTFGRMAAFNGQMGMFTRALAYILSHGIDGLRQVSGDAVLGANYLLSKRTQLYTLYSHQSVKNGGKAGMYSLTSSDNRQSQLSAGIAHTF